METVFPWRGKANTAPHRPSSQAAAWCPRPGEVRAVESDAYRKREAPAPLPVRGLHHALRGQTLEVQSDSEAHRSAVEPELVHFPGPLEPAAEVRHKVTVGFDGIGIDVEQVVHREV